MIKQLVVSHKLKDTVFIVALKPYLTSLDSHGYLEYSPTGKASKYIVKAARKYLAKYRHAISIADKCKPLSKHWSKWRGIAHRQRLKCNKLGHDISVPKGWEFWSSPEYYTIKTEWIEC